MPGFNQIFRFLLGGRLGIGAIVLVAALGLSAEAQARYASIVIDFETGQVLHQTNADTRNYPASLVKMMTLYLAFEALERGDLDLGQKLKASRRAAGMPASKLGLKRGETITVRNAILALVTKSANDAAVVVAEALAGKETKFARMMTKKARALGMRRTSFRNASGLPNRRQLSTARDMATLAQALIRDFPQFYDFFSVKQFAYKGRTHRNHNRLLRKYQGADGIKTGYIRASGFNLVASVMRDGRRLIAVVLGGKTPRSRDRHIAKLLDRGFIRLASNGIENSPGPPPRKPLLAAATTGNATTAEAAIGGEVSAATAPKKTAQAEADVASVEIGSTEDPTPDPLWGVQVGAYYRYDPAKRAALEAAKRVPELLDRARVRITHFKGRRGRIYRARLVGLSESRARKACRRLEAIKIDCLVVRVATKIALKDAPRRAAVN